MGFPGDSSISSKKIMMKNMGQDLGHFGTKRIEYLAFTFYFFVKKDFLYAITPIFELQ